MNPFRRHLVGLPLQRSVFTNIDRAPTLVDLTGVLPDDRLGAWLNDAGDLFLDVAHVGQLASAIPDRISPAWLHHMACSLESACRGVGLTTELCRTRARDADASEARQLIADLGASVRTLVPFAILSKFVPDALYRAAASSGDASVPALPHDSPGTMLTRESFALFEACGACGFPPDRLLAEWPAVPADIGDRVRTFCEGHAGFGPLQWEAPGFEDPRYVFTVLQAVFAESDGEQVRHRLRGGAPRRAPAEATPSPSGHGARWPASTMKTLRRVTVMWMEFLERETWYVRRAFHVGFLPLVHRLATEFAMWDVDMTADDVLFLGLDELTAQRPDLALARSRRETYLANSGYLAEHGIVSDRLATMMWTA